MLMTHLYLLLVVNTLLSFIGTQFVHVICLPLFIDTTYVKALLLFVLWYCYCVLTGEFITL